MPWEATPSPPLPPSSTHCRPPPPACNAACERGFKEGRGSVNTVCVPPPPLAAWFPPVRPPVAPRPMRVGCATPPLCANGECSAAHKGTPPPFPPLPPLRSNRTPSAGPLPHPPCRPRLCINGGSFAPQPGMETRVRGTTPLASRSPKRAWHTKGGGPPPERWRRPHSGKDRE